MARAEQGGHAAAGESAASASDYIGGYAVSKQLDAKRFQGYRERPLQPECRNCRHFVSDKIDDGTGWIEEKNFRCTLGKFAVKKLATCDKHETKP